jgi:hypothetical protein
MLPVKIWIVELGNVLGGRSIPIVVIDEETHGDIFTYDVSEWSRRRQKMWTYHLSFEDQIHFVVRRVGTIRSVFGMFVCHSEEGLYCYIQSQFLK